MATSLTRCNRCLFIVGLLYWLCGWRVQLGINLVQVLWSFFVILEQHQSEGIKGWKIYYWVCVFCCSSKNCAKVSIFWWPGCSQAPRKALAMLYLITSCVKASPSCISSWSNKNEGDSFSVSVKNVCWFIYLKFNHIFCYICACTRLVHWNIKTSFFSSKWVVLIM